jgi:hypothetical protein
MLSIPVNTSVDAPGDGVNSVDTVPPISAPSTEEFSSPFYLHYEMSKQLSPLSLCSCGTSRKYVTICGEISKFQILSSFFFPSTL